MQNTLAQNIRDKRQAKGITRYKLAQAAQISQSYVRELECGNRRSPTLPVLRRLANALDCTTDDLVPQECETA